MYRYDGILVLPGLQEKLVRNAPYFILTLKKQLCSDSSHRVTRRQLRRLHNPRMQGELINKISSILQTFSAGRIVPGAPAYFGVGEDDEDPLPTLCS